MLNPLELKQAAAGSAVQLVQQGMRVGLGSGSTAREFVELLGKRVASGLKITAVASSDSTADLAVRCGIDVTDDIEGLDLAVDGADAIVCESLTAIKGLGGALVREKLVAMAATSFVLIVDESKLFADINDSKPTVPIPVEVLPFAWQLTCQRLESFGSPRIRRVFDGTPFLTDNGNFIIDVFNYNSDDLFGLASHIKMISGVVDHGLFLNLASSAHVATSGDGVVILTPSR